MEKLAYFKNKYFFYANEEIKSYNNHIDNCKREGFEPLEEKTEFVKKFANINTQTGKASINHTKIDQLINESACNEVFNHIDFIREAWKEANYDIRNWEYKELLQPKEMQRKTKLTVMEIIKAFQTLEPDSVFIFNTEEMNNQLKQLKKQYPVIYEAYRKLTLEEIESTNYNEKEMQKLLILKNNKDAEMKIIKLLPLYFSV